MINNRMLLSGVLTRAATPATGRGADGLREVGLEVSLGGEWQSWRVLLATPEADAEFAGLEFGAPVACVGWASRPRFPGDELSRVMTADRALAHGRPADQGGGPDERKSSRARSEFLSNLNKAIDRAQEFGSLLERLRIMAVMNAPYARENPLLAWALARNPSVSCEAAEAALAVAHFAALPVEPETAGRRN